MHGLWGNAIPKFWFPISDLGTLSSSRGVEVNDQDKALQLRINATVEANIPASAWDSTVPIVVYDEGVVRQHGTGTLLRVADHFLLITAAHVFKEAAMAQKTLGCGGTRDGYFVAQKNNAHVSSEGQYGSTGDPLDVGLYRIPIEDVARFDPKRFLSLGDVDTGPQPARGVYSLHGYPCVWATPGGDGEKTTLKPLQHTTYRCNREQLLEDYQDQLHILLDGQLEQVTNEQAEPVGYFDRHGAAVPFPRGLGGMSGCSAWCVGNLDVPIERWSQQKPRLAGIQTGVYHSSKIIKVSRWIAVATLILAVFPELRKSFELFRLG